MRYFGNFRTPQRVRKPASASGEMSQRCQGTAYGYLVQMFLFSTPLPIASAFGIPHREGGISSAKSSQHLFICDVTKEGEEQSLGRFHRFPLTAVRLLMFIGAHSEQPLVTGPLGDSCQLDGRKCAARFKCDPKLRYFIGDTGEGILAGLLIGVAWHWRTVARGIAALHLGIDHPQQMGEAAVEPP
ncbi:hypothetical protein [Pseudomonas benzopyrenica]|uniref:hypothetical protein n=1 Tax=Pseudomonas benzopyrenica TaxID=2993566 RepID=UPI003F1386D6